MTNAWNCVSEAMAEDKDYIDWYYENLNRCNIYPDDDTANKRLYRKRDWHKNKGKRRIKEGYKGDRYV